MLIPTGNALAYLNQLETQLLAYIEQESARRKEAVIGGKSDKGKAVRVDGSNDTADQSIREKIKTRNSKFLDSMPTNWN